MNITTDKDLTTEGYIVQRLWQTIRLWMSQTSLRVAGLYATLALAGCMNSDATDAPLIMRKLDLASQSGSMTPYLYTTANQTVYLSWLEPLNNEGHALRFSQYTDLGWLKPRTITEANDFFINWADFPSLIALNDGTLVAHWLKKSGEGKYDYDIKIAFSYDDGATWKRVVVPHSDQIAAEHGFVSLQPWSHDKLMAVWLDGRETKKSDKGIMQLRYATFNKYGTVLEEGLIDDNTCTCCQTALSTTPGGAILAYRDRTDDELRDTVVRHYANGVWSNLQHFSPDHWQIAACPVNGPSLATRGDQTVVAWYSGKDNQPQVYASFSNDAGKHFSTPIRIDLGKPVGRLSAVLTSTGDAYVSWIELRKDNGADLVFRRVSQQAVLSEAYPVTRISPERLSGFPKMAINHENLIFAWTDVNTTSQVSSMIVKIPDNSTK